MKRKGVSKTDFHAGANARTARESDVVGGGNDNAAILLDGLFSRSSTAALRTYPF